jgi:glycosyltransferase involved in cell wall biosynthesis
MRVALVHYWLTGMRGGERVLEAICRLFPEADIFTVFYEPDSVSPLLRSRNIQASFLNPLRRLRKPLLGLIPLALETFDLRAYDLVISSESGPAKGVLTSSRTQHVCYCHTPMRYLWELYPEYRKNFGGGPIGRFALSAITHHMRTWDVATSYGVDRFFANSQNVRRRIWKTYRRKAKVIYPPVDVECFYSKPSEDYFLIVSEMVPYKQLDYAVRCFAQNGRRLKIVGSGPEYARLRRLAKPNIEFCGRVPQQQLFELYAKCAAFLLPGEEDFGMTMVEALASGKPVIALARGGAVEIVEQGNGVLYAEPTEAALEEALRVFQMTQAKFDGAELMHFSARFSETEFHRRLLAGLAAQWDRSRPLRTHLNLAPDVILDVQPSRPARVVSMPPA